MHPHFFSIHIPSCQVVFALYYTHYIAHTALYTLHSTLYTLHTTHYTLHTPSQIIFSWSIELTILF